MYNSKKFPTPAWEVVYEYLMQSTHAVVIGIRPDFYPETTIIPYRFFGSLDRPEEGKIEVHLVQGDQTLEALLLRPKATILVNQPLSLIPHKTFDERDTNRTMLLFRAVRLTGSVEISTNLKEIGAGLDRLAEGLFPTDSRDPVTIEQYGDRLSRLAHVTISIDGIGSKWKLAQDQPLHLRQRIVDFLNQRNEPLDQITLPILQDFWNREP